MEQAHTTQLPYSPQEPQIPPQVPEPGKPWLKIFLLLTLGLVLALGLVFAGVKISQKQTQPSSTPTPFINGGSMEKKVFCQEPRPEVCTMKCIVNPPYICGSEGKSYCSICQACSNPEVAWYVTQNTPCISQ